MGDPEVSIIVPAFNQWQRTDACLRSLMATAAPSRHGAEIVLADDGSTDETPQAWRKFEGGAWPVRHHRSEPNVGFLRNCNAAARIARGRYLCFLNNDVVVPPGWLDQLLETIETQPNVGAVGPMFLDESGQILECGGITHADGSARQLGQGASPTDRRYQFLNDVDYVSAACLLLRTELFWRFGGFDERYVPCYYEDTDLCMKVSEAGLRVVVDPRVRIVHFEGSSHGTDLLGGMKRNQEVNRERFYDRWKERLLGRHSSAEEERYDRMRVWRRKGVIVFHYPRTPTYDQDSGALRIWSILVELSRRGYHVVLVCPSEMNTYLARLQGAGIETVQAWWGGDEDCLRVVRRYAPMAAVFSHWESEDWFAKSYEAFSPDTIRLFDTVDLAFLRELRRLALANGFTGQPDITPETLSPEALREVGSALGSDVTLVVSDVEREVLTRSLFFDESLVRVVSNLHEPATVRRPFEDRDGFAFLGGFNHPPNVDAIRWIVGEIWPLIRCELPQARLKVYGSGMPDQVKVLHDPPRGVDVLGFVADHREALGAVRVMLCPLRYGAGVKGKIGEALAVGTPTVTTSVGAESMDEEGQALAVGADPAALARLAIRLHSDEAEWRRRSEAGIAVLQKKYSVAANVDELLAAIADARQRRGQASIWNLFRRVLWHTRGCPGEPQDLARNLESLLRKSSTQAALIEQYKISITKLREREARLVRDLAQSAAARQQLLRRP